MNIREIKPGILYSGVNDRVIDRFEALWPVPNGVSYNSYIVRGTEKTALIDTVEVGTLPDFLRGLSQLLAGKKIDYIVVNHMEPDHSGSIPMILSSFPESKVVGNKQTLGMLKGFYNIEDSRLLEINDGSTLGLGGKTLRFFLTPMVHWPETMMTYVEEDSVLFSGDAFGCFGALNGGVVDNEMETSWYVSEMYRYYSNIVGKYGKFVMRAIDKLKDIKIDYICSTHGPVWHDRVGEVVALYTNLAQYKSEEGVTIVYGSMYGNTAEVAEEIGRQLSQRGVRNIKIYNACHAEMSYMISDAFRYRGLIVGSATYSMHILPPVEQFMIAMETREVKDKVFATFGSFTWASAAAAKINSYASEINMEVVDSVVMKQAINDEILEEIRRFADNFVAALKENQ